MNDNSGIIKQIEKIRSTYSDLTIETLTKLVEEVFSKENPRHEKWSYWTGIGGVGNVIDSYVEVGLGVDFALACITLVDNRGTGLYEVCTEPNYERKMNKALFLDLDGTIIKTKSGETFPKDINDWEFNTGVLTKIKAYKNEGYNIVIVTNQGGIESGHITKQDMENKLEAISKEIEQYIDQGVNYFYCGNMESYFRKPNPGMAYQMAIQLELSLRNSVMVGRTESDAKFAKNAYIGTYLDIKDFINEDIIR